MVFTGLSHLFFTVPFVPTTAPVIEVMLDMAKLRDGDVVYDLGAGDGCVLIAAKKLCPGIVARGCEIVPTVWAWGKLKIWWSGEEVDLRLKNALKEDVSDADVVLLYITPPLMAKLEPRFKRQLKPGTVVLSHAFRFPGRPHTDDRVVQTWKGPVRVYRYDW